MDEFDEPRRYVQGTTRARLVDLIADHRVPLVGTGHVHQWRQVDDACCRHVWAPSTWAYLPEDLQPTIGSKVTGILEITLDPSRPPAVELVRPTDLIDLVIGDDFPSPYAH